MKIRLFIFLLLLSLASPFVAQAAMDEAQAVLNVVSTFYKGYLTPYESNDRMYDWRKQPEIDPSFVSKIDALLAEARKENEEYGLGYDPIIMGQDAPQNMEYLTPVIKGDVAEVGAYKVWSKEDIVYSLCVTLKKSDGAWRIIDVIDMDWDEWDEVLECGGLKRAPKG